MDDKRFEDFMVRTDRDLEYIRLRMDKLWDFKTLMIGGSAFVSAITAAIVSVAMLYAEYKR